MRPRLAHGVRVRPDPRDGASVLLSPERGLRLSPTAAATIALCDGTREVDAVVDALLARFATADRARVDADVRAMLRDLGARGLMVGFDRAAPRAVREDGAADAAVGDAAGGAPYTLVAELTHRCALACPYCSNPRELVRGADELTTEAWLHVIDDAAALGVMQMHLTGGEPLARADLEALAARGRARDLYVSLVTSGVPLDRARLEALAPSLDHVQLSVQAADEISSDRIADFAGWAQKMRVARWVKDLGLPLTVNVVLHRDNVDRVGEVVAMAERLGADRLELANVQLVSWALENRASLLPSAASIEGARAIAAEARRRLEGTMQIVFVLPDWHADRPRACMDGWARRFVIVAPDGAVLPCHAARALPLHFEGVRTRPLRAIWEDGAALRAFRGDAWMPEPCASCDRKGIDFGGCRCQAFALTGDVRATDPACPLSPDHAIVRAARLAAETTASSPRYVFRGR